MASNDPQVQTMIDNLPEKTGKSLDEWFALLKKAGLEKHGEMMSLLKGEYDVSHGFANTIVLLYRQQAAGGPASGDDLVAQQYAGPKAELKALYDEIIETVASFGKDVEIAPKKSYVSLRRSKQFGLVQPSTKTRIDLGLVFKDQQPEGALEASGSFNSMCSHRIRLESPEDFNQEVKAWLKKAYEEA